MEYVGFFALIFMGALLAVVALLNALMLRYTPDNPSWKERRNAAVVGGCAVATSAFFLYRAYTHAPFEIIAR
jgi:hypothetical protein